MLRTCRYLAKRSGRAEVEQTLAPRQPKVNLRDKFEELTIYVDFCFKPGEVSRATPIEPTDNLRHSFVCVV